MRIPTVSEPVLFCLKAASPEDNIPAEMRPARITKVWGCTPDNATVNLMVDLDGPNDVSGMLKAKSDSYVEGFQMWRSSAEYDPKCGEGTWCYVDDVYKYEEHVEQIIVKYEITHGRETIRAGAKGIYNTEKNTISFDNSDVTNLNTDLGAVYPADKFINQHISRMQAPAGFMPMIAIVESDGSEDPAERSAMIADMIRTMKDQEYREMRMAGMPAPMPGSLHKAMETRQKELAAPSPRTNRGQVLTSGDNEGENETRRQLQDTNA
jgi:hypothetical protein